MGYLKRYFLSTPTLSSCVIVAAHVSCPCHLALAIDYRVEGTAARHVCTAVGMAGLPCTYGVDVAMMMEAVARPGGRL
jgi:hypothetical protein